MALSLYLGGIEMLLLEIGHEYYDEDLNQFVLKPTKIVRMEHSLRTIAKWEAKYMKPFLVNSPPHEPEELLDYYLMMSVDGDLELDDIDDRVVTEVAEYIKSPNSATTIKREDDKQKKNKKPPKIYTSEVLYALMFMNGVHISADTWHVNRLMLTLEVISDYNTPADKKKIPKKDLLQKNRELNRQRRKKLNTKG